MYPYAKITDGRTRHSVSSELPMAWTPPAAMTNPMPGPAPLPVHSRWGPPVQNNGWYAPAGVNVAAVSRDPRLARYARAPAPVPSLPQIARFGKQVDVSNSRKKLSTDVRENQSKKNKPNKHMFFGNEDVEANKKTLTNIMSQANELFAIDKINKGQYNALILQVRQGLHLIEKIKHTEMELNTVRWALTSRK